MLDDFRGENSRAGPAVEGLFVFHELAHEVEIGRNDRSSSFHKTVGIHEAE